MSSSMKNLALTSLVLIFTLFTALSMAAPTSGNNRENNAATATTESSIVFEMEISTRKSVRTTYSRNTTRPPVLSPSYSGRISNSRLTIEEWVSTKSKQPDVDALALSVALMPELRIELNPNVTRYSYLASWDVNELPQNRTAPWDMLMNFFTSYPAICDAFLTTSNYVKLPTCVQRLYLEPRETLIREGTTWKCRVSPFATNCSAQIALIGTGLSDEMVELWDRRMRAFSPYLVSVAPNQENRLGATIEASCYQYVLCLKANAKDDAGLRKCIDDVVKFGGILLRKK